MSDIEVKLYEFAHRWQTATFSKPFGIETKVKHVNRRIATRQQCRTDGTTSVATKLFFAIVVRFDSPSCANLTPP